MITKQIETESPVEKRKISTLMIQPSLKRQMQMLALMRSCHYADLMEEAVILYLAQTDAAIEPAEAIAS